MRKSGWAYIAMTAGDCFTTVIGVGYMGMREMNPVAREVFNHLTAWGIIPLNVVSVALVLYGIHTSEKLMERFVRPTSAFQYLLLVLIVGKAAIVVSNTQLILSHF